MTELQPKVVLREAVGLTQRKMYILGIKTVYEEPLWYMRTPDLAPALEPSDPSKR